MQENELVMQKVIVNEGEFRAVYDFLANNSFDDVANIIQKNLYFDTENFYFFKRNISIKLRLINEVYVLIMKSVNLQDSSKSKNEAITVELSEKTALAMILYGEVPEKLKSFLVQQKMPVNLTYKGAMVIKRTVFKHKHFTVFLDQNDYLGHRDFELKVVSKDVEKIQSSLFEYLNQFPDSKWSKYESFARGILKTKDNHCKVQVSVIMENRKGEILLIKKGTIQSTVANKLIPPGGHVDFFESIEEAARREIIEETNLDLDGLSLSLAAIVYFRNSELLKQSICFFFYVQLPADFKLAPKSNEFDIEINWINLSDCVTTLSNKLTNYHRQIIDHARLENNKILYLDIQTDKGIIRSY